MRCLFCGKELALLKRLRGGGEFCSEAHRKEYQDQYEQLAVARLMQAKPPTEPAAPLGRPPLSAIVESLRQPEPAPAPQEPQPQPHPSVRMIEAPAPSRTAAAKPAEESGPAPLAGFVGDPVVPAVTVFRHAGPLELERVATRSPSLPSAATASASHESLAAAPRVEFDLSLRALDHHTRTSERGMDLREFAGPAPLVELHLHPATGTEPAGAADVMEVLMSPHPPQKATPWLGVSRGFPASPAELGELARLNFSTTGFAYSDGPAAAGPAVNMTGTTPAAVLTPEAPPVEPLVEAPVDAMVEAPVEAVVETTVAPPAEAASAEPPPQAEPAPPELVTTALPVTLHGLAAPRGKLTQTLTSAIAAVSDVQIPLSAALPLRPTIVFGPAPTAPAPTAPAPAQPKPVKEKTESSFKTSVVPVPKGVPVKRPAAPEPAPQETKAPENKAPEIKAPKAAAPAAPNPRVEQRVEQRVEPRAEQRPEPRKQSPAPEPQEAPAASHDAFPSLRLEATESAWSKLSTGLKIGVAAALIAAISGIGYLVTRGGGKTATQQAPAPAPATASVASGVPISGGWIDDWANASKSKRHVSMLSGSAKLSDYRMEFQAQIQTKAIGWIFRGLNPRNYYVTKLETVKPGLEPTVALVHFAVVDGQDENRVVVPLSMNVRVDTTYKIRFEAVGNHFITWIQDQKVDDWTDSRFGSGGVGLFSDRDEQAAMQGTVNVVALVPKN